MNLLFVLLLFITAVAHPAEFLILAKDNWMVDADKTGWTQNQLDSVARQYRRGDIVDVFEDGKLSNYAHAGGKFYVVRISGITKAQADKYLVKHDNGDGVYIQRRLYKIRVEDVPQAIKMKLQTDHWVNLEWIQVKNYIRNKATGLDE